MTERVKLRQCQKPDKHVYFFSSALEQCNRKHLEPFIVKKLEELEAMYAIVHSAALEEHFKANKQTLGDHPIDPVLLLVLGSKKECSQTEILAYMERDLVFQRTPAYRVENETSFLDLCLILGDFGRAEDYDNRNKKSHDLLSIIKSNRGLLPDKLIDDEIGNFWLKSKKVEDRELTIVIMRLIQYSQIKPVTSWIAEFWGRGYHWDSICLGTILEPDSPQTANIKKKISEVIGDPSVNIWINTVKYLFELEKEERNDSETNYEFADAMIAYRILKVEISKFHRSKQQELGYMSLSFIQTKSNLLQKIIARFIASDDPYIAQDVARDAVQFISGVAKDNFNDYFPQANRIIFEPAVGMIAHFVTALRSLNPKFNSSNAQTKLFDKQQNEKAETGLMSFVIGRWMQNPDSKKICTQLKFLGSPFSDYCSLLRATLKPIKTSNEFEQFLCNTANLALNLISKLVSGKMTAETLEDDIRGSCKEIEMEITAAHINRLKQDFDTNPLEWVEVQSEKEVKKVIPIDIVQEKVLENKAPEVETDLKDVDTNADTLEQEEPETYYSDINTAKSEEFIITPSVSVESNIHQDSCESSSAAPTNEANFEEKGEPTEDEMDSTQSASVEEIVNTEPEKLEKAKTKKYGNTGTFAEVNVNWANVRSQEPGHVSESEEEKGDAADGNTSVSNEAQSPFNLESKLDKMLTDVGKEEKPNETSLQQPVQASQSIQSDFSSGDKLSTPVQSNDPARSFTYGGFDDTGSFCQLETTDMRKNSENDEGTHSPYSNKGFAYRDSGSRGGAGFHTAHNSSNDRYENRNSNNRYNSFSGSESGSYIPRGRGRGRGENFRRNQMGYNR